MIYLDNAATSLIKPPAVKAAMQYALTHCAGVGRGGHAAAMQAADILFDCREEAAQLLGVADASRICFTGNATQALNTAINHLFPESGQVLISGFEHNAVTRPLHARANRGVTITEISAPLFDPHACVKAFADALNSDVKLVVINHISNVYGYIQPVERIGMLCAQQQIPLIIDASQSAGHIPLQADMLPHAFWCMPGHKGLMGPQGTGLIIVPHGVMPDPFVYGGTGSFSASPDMPELLPDRLEAGTHNLPGIAGLLAGMRFIRQEGVGLIGRHEQALIAQAVQELSYIPGITLYYAPRLFCQSGVLSFTVRGLPSEEVAARLGEMNIAVRAGLHCAPSAHKSGGTFPDGTVRIGVSRFNKRQDISILAAALRQVMAQTP